MKILLQWCTCRLFTCHQFDRIPRTSTFESLWQEKKKTSDAIDFNTIKKVRETQSIVLKLRHSIVPNVVHPHKHITIFNWQSSHVPCQPEPSSLWRKNENLVGRRKNIHNWTWADTSPLSSFRLVLQICILHRGAKKNIKTPTFDNAKSKVCTSWNGMIHKALKIPTSRLLQTKNKVFCKSFVSVHCICVIYSGGRWPACSLFTVYVGIHAHIIRFSMCSCCGT